MEQETTWKRDKQAEALYLQLQRGKATLSAVFMWNWDPKAELHTSLLSLQLQECCLEGHRYQCLHKGGFR